MKYQFIHSFIRLGVIGILMKEHQVAGFWPVRIYYIGNRWYEKNKKKWAKERALGHTCGYQRRHLGGLGGPSPPQGKSKKEKKERKKRKNEKKREKKEKKKEGNYEWRQITTYKVLFFPIFQ